MSAPVGEYQSLFDARCSGARLGMAAVERRELAGFGWDVSLLLCLFVVVITAGARLLGGQAGFEDVSMVSATAAAKMLARLT